MSDAKKKVMQAFLLICSEWSDSHFLMFMKTHINLCEDFTNIYKRFIEEKWTSDERVITDIQ